MDYTPDERYLADKMHKLSDEVDQATKRHLGGVQDHINFNLQQQYFKCAYECFDRTRSTDEISKCVHTCSFPIERANRVLQNEMSQFQERLTRSLMVCQDKYETSKVTKQNDIAFKELDSCISGTVKEQLDALPHVANRVKQTLSQSHLEKTSNF